MIINEILHSEKQAKAFCEMQEDQTIMSSYWLGKYQAYKHMLDLIKVYAKSCKLKNS